MYKKIKLRAIFYDRFQQFEWANRPHVGAVRSIFLQAACHGMTSCDDGNEGLSIEKSRLEPT